MKKEIIKLIADDELDSAISLMLDYLIIQSEVSAISGRLKYLENEKNQGKLSFDEITRERNSIRTSLNELTKKIYDDTNEVGGTWVRKYYSQLDECSLAWLDSLQKANGSFTKYVKKDLERFGVRAIDFIDDINTETLKLIGEYQYSELNIDESKILVGTRLIPQVLFKTFWKEAYEETLLTKTDGSFYLPEDDLAPVKVSWLDAAKFANWLSVKKGLEQVYVVMEKTVENISNSARKRAGSTARIISYFKEDLAKSGYRLPMVKEWNLAAKNNILMDWGEDWEWCNDEDADQETEGNPEKVLKGKYKDNYKSKSSDAQDKVEALYYFRLVINIPKT